MELGRYSGRERPPSSIATMDPAAPLPTLDDQVPTWQQAAALARDWELKRLAERFDQLAASI